MNLFLELLARVYDTLYSAARAGTREARQIVPKLMWVIGIFAIVAEFLDFGDFVEWAQDTGERRQAIADVRQLLINTGADRALVTSFREGERRAHINLPAGAQRPVSMANTVVSVRLYPYSDLYQDHKDGKCWEYILPDSPDPRDALAAGMEAVQARWLLSCPAIHRGALVGAVSISKEAAPTEGELQSLQQQLQETAAILAPFIEKVKTED